MGRYPITLVEKMHIDEIQKKIASGEVSSATGRQLGDHNVARKKIPGNH